MRRPRPQAPGLERTAWKPPPQPWQRPAPVRARLLPQLQHRPIVQPLPGRLSPVSRSCRLDARQAGVPALPRCATARLWRGWQGALHGR